MEKLITIKSAIHNMKLLILCPGTIPNNISDIKCFTDVLNYYLPKSLTLVDGIDVEVRNIPNDDNPRLKELFATMPVIEHDVILTLGLRFFSRISKETAWSLRNRFSGLICQIHDGTRLDYDPVDITFTIKNDDTRLLDNPKRYTRHKQNNAYAGWATDFEVNTPQQDANELRILIDHTNYGDNPVDLTEQVITEVKRFVESEIWRPQYQSVSVRRFDSGRVIDVEFSGQPIQRYDRTATMPFSEITKEHCAAHVFCVTHPESVGLVVLETAAAGALPVVPKGFIAQDRLDTVRHVEWSGSVDWLQVINEIDIERSRAVAANNTWDAVAQRIHAALQRRIRGEAL